MDYYIYNNTDYTISATDVHYSSDFEQGSGGSLGITKLFRIEPHSWNTTRRCKSDEVEASLSAGILKSSLDNGRILVCTKEEYEVKTREQASNRLESSMGISGQEKEVQQGFGFLNKVVKKQSNSIDIADLIVDSVDEDEDDVLDEDVVLEDKTELRIKALESSVSSIQGALSDIVTLLKNGKAPQKKAVTKKPAQKKKTNVQNRKRK